MNSQTHYYLCRILINVYLSASMGVTAVLFVPQDSITVSTGSNATYMISWLLLYVLSIVMAFTLKLRINKWFLLSLSIPLYHLVSTLWSELTMKTLIYSSCFVLNAVVVYLIYRVYSLKEVPRLIVNCLFLLSFLGLMAYFLGVESVKYFDIHSRLNVLGLEPMRGFFNHKITAGLYSSIGFLISWLILGGRKKYIYSFVFLIFNLMTGSATGLSLLVIGCFILLTLSLCKRYRIKPNVFIICLTLSIFLSIFLFQLFSADVLVMLGRDPTLTGRTLLWSWGIEAGLQRIWFGWGYLGYLGTDIAGNVAETYVEFQNYNVPHFHNSIIQIFANGGIIYTIYLILIIIFAMKSWYDYYLKNEDNSAMIFCLLVLLISVSSIFVYVFSRYNDFPTILLMIMISFMPKNEMKQNKLSSDYKL
ncbi:hypothetical protein CSW98_02655 [Vibrio sp. HA2012]|uniref:O-antigen ligase family protein n=1 Tax=Vibrio sp. HA2012 TaxID=1971595 RepID=UPI000C2CB09F|nr:O-antigen ligase family protein [Vibrio sp. HA2012]PJC88038.1 hypothetical protein CSW98_02655 [Vibrio sp. HA2012]